MIKQKKKPISSMRKRTIGLFVALGLLFVGSSFKEDFFEIAKQLEIFTTLYKTVNQNYVDETNPAELMDKAIKSMLADLDPYTNYFNEQDVVRFKINNTGEYTGMGALVTRKDDRLIIKEPYKGFPADKAGLKAGDAIIKIGDVELKDYKEDASQLLRGIKNAEFLLTYIRQGKTLTTKLVLNEIDLKAVPFYEMIDNETGYIVLSQFTRKASQETKEAFEALKAKGMKKLVFDLRGNPGGLLHEAVNICSFFVPKDEVIVTTKSKNEKYNNIYKTTREPLDTEIPIVILVDGKSASASEIVSGALQDLDRAVVVGSRSYGKGLVQRPIDLSYGTQIKITISRYYTPSGRCIQALNYAKKDKGGKATRTEEKNYNAFKTRNQRTVYDGGGIQPDVELPESKNSVLSENLQKHEVLFDFATQYYYKKPQPADGIPTLTDADFTEFKAYLKSEKISLQTDSDLALEALQQAFKKEHNDQAVSAELQQVKLALQKNEENQLTKNKAEILQLLKDELIKRYQYKEGLYQYYAQQNTVIKKAVALLQNGSEYNKILKKG